MVSSRSRMLAAGTVSVLVVALAGPLMSPTAASAERSAPAASESKAAFAAAATESGVPEPMLLALSYAMTRWETHAGAPSTGGGFGPMHLIDPSAVDGRGDPARTPIRRASALHQAAGLIHSPAATVRTDSRANIRAGAALLA